MAILSAIKEGSEEARHKRAVRRYLNKKKQKPVEEAVVDESSEEARQARAKRMKQKEKDKKEPIEEAVIVGSIPHMEHSVHNYHEHGFESPEYHIHKVGHSSSEAGSSHQYLVIHRHALSDSLGNTYHPTHHVSVGITDGQRYVQHLGHVRL